MSDQDAGGRAKLAFADKGVLSNITLGKPHS